MAPKCSVRSACVALAALLAACAPSDPESARAARPTWQHLSTTSNDLPQIGPSDQQTGSHTADLDGDGAADIVIVARKEAPSVTWLRRRADGWQKYIIDPEYLRIEAGGASHDIDGDGDLDLAFGADAGDNHIWWWENPAPNFASDIPWTRHVIKDSGENKHHDQLFGDFDHDGQTELVSWNQKAKALLLFEIPENPRESGPWESSVIYSWDEGDEHEGLAAGDVNGDGRIDIVGGGRWFPYSEEEGFTPTLIDDAYRFSRAAIADLVEGGSPEIVFQPGDKDGPARWYEWDGAQWNGHNLATGDVIHGHSLAVADIDGDRHQDIFSAEMGRWGADPNFNAAPRTRIFYGDGQGSFEESLVSAEIGCHECRIADLDGDGDPDILAKPYNWNAPRVDVFLQQ